MRIAIGIDTGGTCTDAILYDFDTREVLGQNKALTTYDDLSRGMLKALDGLDQTLCCQAVAAGLSTTLATNACVAGNFRSTRLLLMGINRTGIERFGADYGFHDPDEIRYLPCRTTIDGHIIEEPDWNMLRKNAKEWFEGVEGCAVCEIYGIRNNAELERRAAAIIEEETGLPVACASLLFTGLSSLERAASAVLNAGLLPITRDFLDAVGRAFHERGIDAPIMIVRSDSSLMSRDYSAEHAVETLLSGPAASALGGSALSDSPDTVVIDMGGTTTDIALIENGLPLLSKEGIRVGQWRTMVNGLFANSFALGGDSAIHWDFYGNLTIGPARVIPLCILAEEYPDSIQELKRQIHATPTHTLPLHEFLTLGRSDWDVLDLTDEERMLCHALEDGPLILQKAADLLGLDKYQLDVSSLERSGVILRAGLTPTDVMHVRGDYARYHAETSALAVQFAAESIQMEVEDFCERIYENISREVFFGISQLLLEYASPHYRKNGLDKGMRELLRLQWENRRTGGSKLLRYAFHAPALLVGIGGPIHLFLPEAASALGAQYLVPECAATANAVGAVTGQITVSHTAEIRPHGLSWEDDVKCDYAVLCPGHSITLFQDEEEAIEWTREQLMQETCKRVREQGANGALTTTCDTQEIIGDRTRLCTKVIVTTSTCLTEKKGKEKQ